MINQIAKRLSPRLVRPLRRVYLRLTARLYDPRIERSLSTLTENAQWESPPCALCGDHDVEPHNRKFGLQTVRCRNDGPLFVSPRPVDIAPFYSSDYYQSGLPGLYRNYDRCARSLEAEWTTRLERLEESIGKGHLLDIGCATGAFMTLAIQRGWRASGIELSGWAAEVARSRGLDVVTGSLPNDAFKGEMFDAVTLWDCVEHLSAPAIVLAEAHRLLRPGGRLMLTTGAVPHKDPKRSSIWYFPPWHLYYFSTETLTGALENAGLPVVDIDTTEAGQPWALMVVTARPKT